MIPGLSEEARRKEEKIVPKNHILAVKHLLPIVYSSYFFANLVLIIVFVFVGNR